ncbi:hypothetical protein H696_05123 [Fonticula alba]|uniref:E2F-associated phosphoprotein n=1 Tax=Fonticula alba TaxID=691883 RepID=A0A058Z1N3_FONAL|nr:hypothetical protein H696_05123 [Fonticula alba]KCV68194.1 hypothetical protein H696_05123 [Fonticula alba]|eukprot:XP_009497248.1 hypothetical protein H696_05123 [Fonticula alba]
MSSPQSNAPPDGGPPTYDPLYFDSDEDMDSEAESIEDGVGHKKRAPRQRPVISDADLLYDPQHDIDDEIWVQHRYMHHHHPVAESIRAMRDTSGTPPARGSAGDEGSGRSDFVESDDEDLRLQRRRPQTDAVLSCPGCFTTLTYECRQHAEHKNQFHATKVVNILVNKKTPVATSGESTYFQAVCKVCRNPVGVCNQNGEFDLFDLLTGF